MRKIALGISLIFFAAAISVAQKKELSYEQSFKAATSDIVKPLPVIREWIDDEHYTESKKDADGKTKLWSVDVKTELLLFIKMMLLNLRRSEQQTLPTKIKI